MYGFELQGFPRAVAIPSFLSVDALLGQDLLPMSFSPEARQTIPTGMGDAPSNDGMGRCKSPSHVSCKSRVTGGK